MRNCFVDVSHKEAFDLLYKEAWRPEEGAMGNSTLPTVLDKLCMVANINARKLIELKKAAPVFLFLPYLTDTCATYSLIISPQALCNN